MTHDRDIVRNALLQFIQEHGDMFPSPEDAFNYFMKEFNMSGHDPGALNFEQSDPFLQSLETFQEAMNATSKSKRNQLLDQALELWPNNWHIHAYQLMTSESIDLTDLIDKYEKLERKAYNETWKKNAEREAVEVDAYLTIKKHFSDILFECGLLDKAQKHYEELLRMDKTDSAGARYKLLAIYARKYDWKNAWKFYLKVDEAESDDQILLPIIILAILTGRLEVGLKLFKQLMEVNPDVSYLFEEEEEWPYSDILESNDVLSERFAPFSYDSLLLSLYDLLPLLYDNLYLYETLIKAYDQADTQSDGQVNSRSVFLKLMRVEEDTAPPYLTEKVRMNLFSMHSQDESNPLRNIGVEQIRLLIQNHLQTYDDFLKKTEAQVKSIRGIGPVTIKKLKENNVRFKDS